MIIRRSAYLLNISFALFSVLILSCGGKEVASLDKNDFLKYIEASENSFVLEKDMNEVEFKCMHAPKEYMACKYSSNEKDYQKELKEYGSLLYFKFRLKSANNSKVLSIGVNNFEDYYKRIDYLNYGYEQDFKLIVNNDSIPPALFQVDRTLNNGPFVDVIMAFDVSKKENYKKLLLNYEDKLFDKGSVNFKYLTEDINNIPKIVWN